MKLGGYLFFMFFFFLIVFGFIIQGVIQHEYLHQLVFQKYGISSNVTYNFWGATKQQLGDMIAVNPFRNADINRIEAWAWTTPDWNSTEKCDGDCRLLQTQIEIEDHFSMNISMAIFGIILFYVLFSVLNNSEEREEYKIEIDENVIGDRFKFYTPK